MIRATLISIVPPNPDWWDTRKQSIFVYKTDMGAIENVTADFVPVDCREIGKEYWLDYVSFSIGDASGFHYEPRSLTPVDHAGEIPW